MTSSRPSRTCVGCRTSGEQAQLLRLATVGGRVVPDPSRRLLGRGAWLHPDRSCLEIALERGAFQRAFKAPVAVPDDTVESILTWQRSASTS